MLKSQSSPLVYIVASFCMICLTVWPANAQTSSSPPSVPASHDDAQKAPPSSDVQSGGNGKQEDPGVISMDFTPTVDKPLVKELGGGGNWFSDNVDWLHWGPVGFRSAEVFYTYYSQDAPAGTLSAPAHLSVATLQTDIAYSQRLQHSRLIWQYSPRMLVVNGHVSRQLSNQDSTLDLLFVPTSRMTLGINDWFSYYGQDNVLNDKNLDINQFSGALMNPFLNNGQQTLMNSVAVPLAYKTSARTNLSVSPFFNYAQISDNGNANAAVPLAQPLDLSMIQYGATAQVQHSLSADQSIGAFYTYQTSQQSGAVETAFFHSFGGTISRRLGRSFLMTGDAGGSYSAQAGLNTWTGVGSLSLTKSFRHSSIQGTYGRGVTFSGFLGNGYSNYAWVKCSRQFGRKLMMDAGFGYLTSPTLQQQSNGKYVNGTISYELLRNVSWFVGYSSFWQSGKGVQLTTGNQSQIQAGLRWAPLRRTAILEAGR